MITRWRIEAEAENREDVEEKLESATQAMLGHLRDTQPEDQWECTDDPIFATEHDGGAVIYGRRVFRVVEEEVFGG